MDTSNSERCGAAEVTTPIKHLPKNYVGELIANSRLNRELVSHRRRNLETLAPWPSRPFPPHLALSPTGARVLKGWGRGQGEGDSSFRGDLPILALIELRGDF
jgi:hypothetical protein